MESHAEPHVGWLPQRQTAWPVKGRERAPGPFEAAFAPGFRATPDSESISTGTAISGKKKKTFGDVIRAAV